MQTSWTAPAWVQWRHVVAGSIPEPSAYLRLVVGLGLLGFVIRRRAGGTTAWLEPSSSRCPAMALAESGCGTRKFNDGSSGHRRTTRD